MFGDRRWIKIDTPIDDPFRANTRGDKFFVSSSFVFKNPKVLRELIATKNTKEKEKEKKKNMWKFRKKGQAHKDYIKQIKTVLGERKKQAIEKSTASGKKRKTELFEKQARDARAALEKWKAGKGDLIQQIEKGGRRKIKTKRKTKRKNKRKTRRKRKYQRKRRKITLKKKYVLI